jgi:hypothetical protein
MADLVVAERGDMVDLKCNFRGAVIRPMLNRLAQPKSFKHTLGDKKAR